MLKRNHRSWKSRSLAGRQMDVLVLGHAGARVLVFPTSQGSYHEWDDRDMSHPVRAELAEGRLQLFCVGSADDASWYNERIPLHARAQWQQRYDGFLLDEVLPFTETLNADPMLITVGASFGGYHAICFGMRYPELVGRVLSMSGLPDIRRLTYGGTDALVSEFNPPEIIQREHDPERLAALRKMDIILAVGHDDALRPANEAFSGILVDRGIGNALRIWDGWAHDWPWWQRMLQLYIGGHD